MKYLLYPIALLLCATSFAQILTSKPAPGLNHYHNQLLEQLLHQQLSQPALKTTGLQERVIASSIYHIYTDSLVKGDTSIYKYSGTRGSQFDYYNNSYNTATPFDDMAPMVNNVFLDHSNKPMVECDTFRQWNIFYSADSTEADAKYDANNNLINYFYSYPVATSHYSYYNKYNSDNSVAYNSRYFSMTDTGYKRYFMYNSAGQLILDSTVLYYYDSTAISNIMKYTYVYDSAGNVIKIGEYGISPTGVESHIINNYFTYNSDNKLKTLTDTAYGMLHPVPGGYDSLAYSPGFNYPTGLYRYEYGSTGKILDNATILHLNKSNLPDTSIYITPYLKDTMITTFVYDSLNNPIIVDRVERKDTFPPKFSYTIYYYYETYTATQVPNISQNTDNIKIYPNPATNEININLADAAKNTQLFVNIVNTNGQLIRTESIPSNSQTWQMSIADLAPGTYFISIRDGAGNKLHVQSIVRQ